MGNTWKTQLSNATSVTTQQVKNMVWIFTGAATCLLSPNTSVTNESHSQKGHLNQHQKEHQGRFGPCPHCRATFAQKSGFVAHVPRWPAEEGGPPEKEHVCEICGRKYSQKGELTWHLKDKH